MCGQDVASTGPEDYDPFTAPKQLFLATRVAPEDLVRLVQITEQFPFGFFISN